MFCCDCGKEVKDNALVCVSCGCKTTQGNQITADICQRNSGWYFGLLLGWLGVIIIVCINSSEKKEKDKFAITGAIYWCVVCEVFLCVFLLYFYLFLLSKISRI
jgi:presenilin-like A22 family membrane protease